MKYLMFTLLLGCQSLALKPGDEVRYVPLEDKTWTYNICRKITVIELLKNDMVKVYAEGCLGREDGEAEIAAKFLIREHE